VTLTSAGTGFGPFQSLIGSIRKVTPEEAAAIRPRVIHVVTVREGDTAQMLASKMAYRNFRLERFLTLNDLAEGAHLKPGQKVKLIVYGSRRA
jgi:predicted Zn-dependent protease